MLLAFATSIGMGAFYTHCPEKESEHHGDCKGDMMGEKMGGQHADAASGGALYKIVCLSFDDLPPALVTQKITLKSHHGLFIILMAASLDADTYECEVFKLPDERCNTGPPLGSNSLRAPPMV